MNRATADNEEGGTPAGSRAPAGEGDAAPNLLGHFYTWERGDRLPPLSPGPELTAAPSDDEVLVAYLTGISERDVHERLQRSHKPWLAYIDDEPVGWGWVAASTADIPALGVAPTLPAGERYLWDFVTVPAWRGQGVYPRLLQAILRQEGADRFWIGHDRDNIASARGIAKAGFQEVGRAYRLPDGRMVFGVGASADRAERAAKLLGLPMGKR